MTSLFVNLLWVADHRYIRFHKIFVPVCVLFFSNFFLRSAPNVDIVTSLSANHTIILLLSFIITSLYTFLNPYFPRKSPLSDLRSYCFFPGQTPTIASRRSWTKPFYKISFSIMLPSFPTGIHFLSYGTYYRRLLHIATYFLRFFGCPIFSFTSPGTTIKPNR